MESDSSADRSGINRFGEEKIRPDHFHDLQKTVDWSQDPRSESAHEGHRGKGPKSFSRTDENLREEVCEAFLLSHDLDPEFMEVQVKDAVVVLTGRARTRGDKWLAEELAFGVSGVKDVQNRIRCGKWDEGDDPGGLIKGIR